MVISTARIKKCPTHNKRLEEQAGGIHMGRGQWVLRMKCPECSFAVTNIGRPPKDTIRKRADGEGERNG